MLYVTYLVKHLVVLPMFIYTMQFSCYIIMVAYKHIMCRCQSGCDSCSCVTCEKRNRGSYMSAHVLLNLLNELGKRDKMRGLPSILSLFRNEFNKFNKTWAQMLDSIYHMTNTLKSHSWREKVIILWFCAQRCFGRHNASRKSINH